MTNFDEAPDSGDIGSGDENDIDQPSSPKPQSLKGVGAKKGPKLARNKKNPTTISNKVNNKAMKTSPKKI